MLRYKIKEKGYQDGRFGMIYKAPYILSVYKDKHIHSARLVAPSSKRYIFNEAHTFEKMVNFNLHCQRRRWDEDQKCEFIFHYDWDEEKQTEKAMERALEGLAALKEYMTNPATTFVPMEEPDIPW